MAQALHSTFGNLETFYTSDKLVIYHTHVSVPNYPGLTTCYQEPVEHHYAHRFIASKTELWFFGHGLGDQLVMEEMGYAFLKYTERFGDPELGRVMVRLSVKAYPAVYPLRGDWNLTWIVSPCDLTGNLQEEYLDKTPVPPDLVLCLSKQNEETVKQYNLPTMHFPFGVNTQIFQPLNKERRGLGYAGTHKDKEQEDIVLGSARNDSRFEWIGKTSSELWRDATGMNDWYNSKEIVFAMTHKLMIKSDMVSNRYYSQLASGTPLITLTLPALEAELGFPFPWQTSNLEQTTQLIEEMQRDYPKTLEKFAVYSKEIRKNHDYEVRIKTLFDKLKVM